MHSCVCVLACLSVFVCICVCVSVCLLWRLSLWFSGKKHEPVEYTGERTVESIEAWLGNEVTNKWDTEPKPSEAAAEGSAKKHEGSEL